MPRRNYPKAKKKSSVAPKTPYLAPTPNIACRQKRRFTTEKQARAAADTQELISPKTELDIYQCEFCAGWHLTSRRRYESGYSEL